MSDDKARLIYKNMVDDPRCVLTCSVAETLPVANVQNTDRTSIARIPSATAISVRGTYGGDYIGASGFAFNRSNLTSAATAQLIGYENADWTGTVRADTGAQLAIPGIPLGELFFGVDPLGLDVFEAYDGVKHGYDWFTRAPMKSWEIIISDTANPDGYVDLQRLSVGQYFELAYNPQYGLKLKFDQNNQSWETDAGSEHVDVSDFFRRLSFDLQNIPEVDRNMWIKVLRWCGRGQRDLFFALYPNDSSASAGRRKRDYAMFATISTMPDLVSAFDGRDTSNISIREI